MQDRHINREKYFEEQSFTTRKYVIPYIEEVLPIDSKTRILEIGCGGEATLLHFLIWAVRSLGWI